MAVFSRLMHFVSLAVFFSFIIAVSVAQTSKPGDLPSGQPSPPPGSDYANGYKAGLAEHQQLLDETRRELDHVRQEVEKVKSNSDWFLSIYALLTAFLLGEGLFSLHKQKSQSEEVRKKAGDAAKEATKAARYARKLAARTKMTADKTNIEMEKINAARKALFSQLPVYLEQTIQAASALNPNTFDAFHKAMVHEVDHLTYLGSTSFHFHEPETDQERKSYCEALMVTVRGHMVQMRPAEALNRIDMFFKLSRNSESVKDSDRSRMYGYRAHAYMALLDELKADLALKKPESQEKARRYRMEITAALENAKNLNANWAGAHFYEAYFYSLYPVSPDMTDAQQRRQFFLDGQSKAIHLYRRLIHDYAKLQPNMVGASRINICCCLKRIADDSGDYKPLFEELAAFPSESRIHANNAHDSGSIDQTSEDLWANLMQESALFEKELNPNFPEKNYKTQWVNILNVKADLSPWQERYTHYLNPTMRAWKIRVWEPD